MKWCLILLAVVAAAACAQIPPYHETQGVPTARRIWDYEQVTGGRISGGSAVDLGAHSYLGGLIVYLFDDRTSMCACSMLSNTRALTAAHCWWDGRSQARALTIVYGSTHLYSGGTRLNITDTSAVLMHNFNPVTYINDLAIIEHPFVAYTAFINRINLPVGTNQYADTWATAVGYGRTTKDLFVEHTAEKRAVLVQVISNVACRLTWAAPLIAAGVLCTNSAHGMSVCAGDAGGPLVATTPSGPVLIGVTSFGADAACNLYFPAAYTRVTSYINWISSRI